jgi:nitric oxide reductase activation protein
MHANCPICRHQANEFEKMPEPIEDDDDETWEADDDEELTLDELAAQERARERFRRYKLINPIEEVQLYAANLIKACWRGYQDRLLFQELLANKEDADYSRRMIEENKIELVKVLIREKFLKNTIGLSRMQVKGFASTKIQAFWRRHKVEAAIGSMSGLWRKIRPGNWEKVILNPEEHEPEIVTQLPSTVA